MKRIVCLFLLFTIVAQSASFALDSDKARYIGGTHPTLPQGAEGRVVTNDPEALLFVGARGGKLPIPYAAITSLEYGQKAGRRVAVALMVSWMALFSKKRNHFLTITYKDEKESEQALVFELGKDIVRTTLTVVETRSGKQIEYTDEEAQKFRRGR
jgi:hypothetical protein